MSISKIVSAVLFTMIGLLFFVEAQAAINVDQMSTCMAQCNGDKNCVDQCVSASTSRGVAKDILQCLAGCGLGVTSQSNEATLKEQIKACCQGCLKAMH